MANQQHIDWLLEGVESWNARREREEFTPDFEGTDLREEFEKTGSFSRTDPVPLDKLNLSGAILTGATLTQASLGQADLRGADLMGADLRGANLWRADLRRADLRRADLRRADLWRADLWRADVQTIAYSAAGINDAGGAEYTNVSTTVGLTQEQLDTMNGDSGTILPKGLDRPANWPELDLGGAPEPESSVGNPERPQATSPALVASVKARSAGEIRAALNASYPNASALAAYLADQVQREIATHKLLPIPNEDDALNAHNAKANFLTEALVVVQALHEALPVEHPAEVTETEANTVRDRLVELAKVVQNGIAYLDSHPGTYGNLWKIGLIGALANLFTVMSIPIAIGAPIAAGVVGISTYRLIVQRGEDER